MGVGVGDNVGVGRGVGVAVTERDVVVVTPEVFCLSAHEARAKESARMERIIRKACGLCIYTPVSPRESVIHFSPDYIILLRLRCREFRRVLLCA